MRRLILLLVVSGTVLNAALLRARADSVTLIPAADTSIFEKSPDNNLGGAQSVAAGNTATADPSRALIKFDVGAALPAGANVTSVSLRLPVVRVPFAIETATFDLHRLLVDWGEGNKNAGLVAGIGSLASPGEATWTSRMHQQQAWTAGGGAAGSDYSEDASASADIAAAEPLVFESTPVLVADVQRWIDSPGANFGWLLKDRVESTSVTARRFGSWENPTDQPKLTIEFDTPLRIKLATIAANQICFSFTARAGKSYRLERREQVDSGEWVVVTTLPAPDITAEALVCDTLESSGSRFYRIAEQQN